MLTAPLQATISGDTLLRFCAGSICLSTIVIILIVYYIIQKKKGLSSTSRVTAGAPAGMGGGPGVSPPPPKKENISLKIPELALKDVEKIMKEGEEVRGGEGLSPSLKYAAERAGYSTEMAVSPAEVEFKPVKFPRETRRELTPPPVPKPSPPPRGVPPIPEPAKPAEPIPPWGGAPRTP